MAPQPTGWRRINISSQLTAQGHLIMGDREAAGTDYEELSFTKTCICTYLEWYIYRRFKCKSTAILNPSQSKDMVFPWGLVL